MERPTQRGVAGGQPEGAGELVVQRLDLAGQVPSARDGACPRGEACLELRDLPARSLERLQTVLAAVVPETWLSPNTRARGGADVAEGLV